VPFVYRLDDSTGASVTLVMDDGSQQTLGELVLPARLSSELFLRSGRIRQIEVVLERSRLFAE